MDEISDYYFVKKDQQTKAEQTKAEQTNFSLPREAKPPTYQDLYNAIVESPGDPYEQASAVIDGNSVRYIDKLPQPLLELYYRTPIELLNEDVITVETLIGASTQMRQLRIMFWRELRASVHESRTMRIEGVVDGVCGIGYFWKKLGDAKFLIYLLMPVTRYEVSVEESLEKGARKLREVLEQGLVDGDGKIQSSLLKAIEMLDKRKYGEYKQEVHNSHDRAPAAKAELKQLDIDKRMKELEEKLGKSSIDAAGILDIPRTKGAR